MFIIYFFEFFTSKILRIAYFFRILIYRVPLKFDTRATSGVEISVVYLGIVHRGPI